MKDGIQVGRVLPLLCSINVPSTVIHLLHFSMISTNGAPRLKSHGAPRFESVSSDVLCSFAKCLQRRSED